MALPKLVAVLALLPSVILALAPEPSSDEFTYYGCVAAIPRAFPHVAAAAPGLSISACQDGCSSYGRFAALGSQQCRCSVEGPFAGNPVTFQMLDSEKCSQPCVEGDASQGMCGGATGSGAWSLWVRGEVGSDLKVRTDGDDDDDDMADDEDVCIEDDDGTTTTLPYGHGIGPIGPWTVFATATSSWVVPTASATTAVVIPTGAASHVGVGALGVALGVGALALVA